MTVPDAHKNFATMSSFNAQDVRVYTDIMVSMPDGVSLAADVYLPPLAMSPDELDSWPTLVHRTPYSKSVTEAEFGWARQLAFNGYAVVIQDCRGCFASEGELEFLFPEAEDGRHTIGWVREQVWCNGKVAMFGTSWCGWAQTAVAAAGVEGITTLVPCQSGFDGRTSSVRQGGATELRWIAWAFWHSASNTQIHRNNPHIAAALNFGANRFSDYLRRGALRKGVSDLALVPHYEKWAFKILGDDYTDEQWRSPSVSAAANIEHYIDVPTLLVGSWYDSYARASLELFSALAATKRGPIKIIMGPWTHSGVNKAFSGDTWFGGHAAIDFLSLHLPWYDRWLRGTDNGVDQQPPVTLFVMGGGSGKRGPGGRIDHGGRWRYENEWPLARTELRDFYLHADGALTTTTPAEFEPPTSFEFDPRRPVPTIGGSNSSFADLAELPNDVTDPRSLSILDRRDEVIKGGGYDQREAPGIFGCEAPYLPLSARPDVLVFRTEPLEEDVEVTGPITVSLWVSSSAKDTDFTAKLVDLYPSSETYPRGYALNISDSIIRLRYRNGPDAAESYDPDSIVPVDIELYPTSNLFVKGHRIRLDISSSNFPRFDVNSNTGEPLGTERRRQVAINTVYHDAQRPSRIKLPLIPATAVTDPARMEDHGHVRPPRPWSDLDRS
ncbi:CocE/NonD family hydrolase [Amycolatopsis pigmentata]|uniref:CocE/NonD family hydrolase n=1 Tax=Amycolatopsis pigmentata TaxID=450801 RepID=A0ABW5FYG9_9PSEU